MPKQSGFTLLELMIIVMIALILWAILMPNFLRARARGQLTACKSNLKNLATALEMYASDHKGRYPEQLQGLEGNQYLKSIPTCPAAGQDTYRTTYSKAVIPPFQGEYYSLYCQGNHHARSFSGFPGDPRNFPQYHSREGLIDHP